MTPLGAAQVAAFVNGTVVGDATRAFTAVFSDSRSVVAGGLFVALKGERFDGHDFIADVAAADAGGAIVRRNTSANVPAGFVRIEVDDPQAALEALGTALRKLHPGKFFAVTGSVGKTTVKDMLAAALATFGKVGKTPGNLNNHIGVPLTLAGLDGDEDFVVIELGMSAPGEIAKLTAIADPDVALVTRAAAAHLEFFADVDAIADAKAELYRHLRPGGVAVVNADDPRMLERARRYRGDSHIITYGREADVLPFPDVQVIGAGHASGGLVAKLTAGADHFDLTVATHGLHNAENAAAAIACCVAAGLDPQRAAASLSAGFRPAKHRLELVKLDALTILDDSYNANPTSTRAALDAFADVARSIPVLNRLAVIGSMRELGPTADTLHAEIGQLAAAVACVVAATGPHAEALATSARDAGAIVLAAAEVSALLAAIGDWARSHPDGAILLKGSRGERLERVLDHLRGPHASDQGGA